jgi:hypothetical protein
VKYRTIKSGEAKWRGRAECICGCGSVVLQKWANQRRVKVESSVRYPQVWIYLLGMYGLTEVTAN